MTNIKKILNALIDADGAESGHDPEKTVAPNSAINMENVRYGTTTDGQEGYYENVEGTTQLPNQVALPAGTNIIIGTAKDEVNGYKVKFNWNSNGDHGIYLYDLNNSQEYTVLMDADVTGGLNFDKYKLINGAYIVGGKLLFFNDANNEPRCLNLWVFIDAYGATPVTADYAVTLPIDEAEITVIKKPMAYPPSIQKIYDSTFNNNFIKNDSFTFAYEYIYYDGQVSVLSTFSKATLLNKEDDDFNYIRVSADSTEEVPQTVRIVRLIVKDGSTGKGVVVKQWDRTITAENTQINNLNLTFDFYNNLSGEAISDVQMVKPFDSVAEVVGSMTIAKNRTVCVDLTSGKDTPGSTSLSLSLPTPVSLGFTSLSKFLYAVQHRNGRAQPETYAYTGWYVYIDATSAPNAQAGYYLVNGTDQLTEISGSYLDIPLPAAPTTAAFTTGLTWKGVSLGAVIAATRPADTFRSDNDTTLTANSCSITGITSTVYNLFTPQSQYKCGVVFYDRYLRKCGVVYTDDIISIPARNYAFTAGYASIEWALSNAGTPTEIPDWAYYYAPVRTLNLRTRYFVAAYSGSTSKYASKDADGLFVYTGTTLANNTVAIALDANALLQANLGYAFKEGDECILIDNSNNKYELPIIGQDGSYILLAPKDIGDLTAKTFVFELYTPYKTSEQEPFFEMGDLFAVTDPGTSSRAYSTLAGSFRADAVAMTRNYNAVTYYAEAMCPNDVYFQRWDTDAGRPNFITKLGSVRQRTAISFSNTYIPGTSTNGLCSFEALNKRNLSEDLGTLRKVILTNKVQQQGSVLLVIGESRCASIYLGEKQFFDADNNSFLASTSEFIGQVNPLKGDYGTQDPESVDEKDGRIFFYDKRHGCFVRYSGDGLFAISDHDLKRFSKLFSDAFNAASIATIEAFGSRPFVFGCYGGYHNEYMVGIPKLSSAAPKGTLSDLDTPMDYPYDKYDGQAKVLMFKNNADAWGGPLKFEPEMMVNIGNVVYSYKNGVAYSHTSATKNTFYGTAQKSRFMFLINEGPSVVKEFCNLAIEGNKAPSYVHIRTERPNVQSSDIDSTEFEEREGVFYAKILRDRLSPNATGTAGAKLFIGDPMRGNWAKILIEFDNTDLLQVRAFNVGVKESIGHQTIKT